MESTLNGSDRSLGVRSETGSLGDLAQGLEVVARQLADASGGGHVELPSGVVDQLAAHCKHPRAEVCQAAVALAAVLRHHASPAQDDVLREAIRGRRELGSHEVCQAINRLASVAAEPEADDLRRLALACWNILGQVVRPAISDAETVRRGIRLLDARSLAQADRVDDPKVAGALLRTPDGGMWPEWESPLRNSALAREIHDRLERLAPARPRKKSKGTWLLAGIAVAVLVMLFVGGFLIGRRAKRVEAPPTPPPVNRPIPPETLRRLAKHVILIVVPVSTGEIEEVQARVIEQLFGNGTSGEAGALPLNVRYVVYSSTPASGCIAAEALCFPRAEVHLADMYQAGMLGDADHVLIVDPIPGDAGPYRDFALRLIQLADQKKDGSLNPLVVPQRLWSGVWGFEILSQDKGSAAPAEHVSRSVLQRKGWATCVADLLVANPRATVSDLAVAASLYMKEAKLGSDAWQRARETLVTALDLGGSDEIARLAMGTEDLAVRRLLMARYPRALTKEEAELFLAADAKPEAYRAALQGWISAVLARWNTGTKS